MIKINKDLEKETENVTVMACVCSCPGGICIPYIVPESGTNYASIFETDERS